MFRPDGVRTGRVQRRFEDAVELLEELCAGDLLVEQVGQDDLDVLRDALLEESGPIEQLPRVVLALAGQLESALLEALRSSLDFCRAILQLV